MILCAEKQKKSCPHILRILPVTFALEAERDNMKNGVPLIALRSCFRPFGRQRDVVQLALASHSEAGRRATGWQQILKKKKNQSRTESAAPPKRLEVQLLL